MSATIQTANPAAVTSERKLSPAGLIRVSIENCLEAIKGKRVNISGPHYKIVQVVAAHLASPSGRNAEARSYSTKGLHELKLTLRQCTAAVDDAIMAESLK